MSTSTTTGRKIPQRPYGTKHGSSRLSDSVSIVGLGCSSFSGFFGVEDEGAVDADAKNDNAVPDWITHTKTNDVETVDAKHPLVRQWVATIHYAIKEAGITLLDTAPWYGHGLSEQVVGLALEELFSTASSDASSKIARKDITLNTKIGRYEENPCQQFNFRRDVTVTSVQRSLQRLRTEYIDVLQLHDPEFSPLLSMLLNETIPAMLECQEKGYCKALGLTGYPLSVQRQIFQATLEHFEGKNIWDQSLTYCHYTLHDTTLLRPCPGQRIKNDSDSHDNDATVVSFADFMETHGCTCLAAAPLSMGLLTPAASPPIWHPASSALRSACQEAAQICRANNVDLAELALLVALAEPRIPTTLLGMKNVAQVKTVQRIAERLEAANFVLAKALTTNERAAYEALSDADAGPFAKVWKQNEHHWGGIQQVRVFWQENLTHDDKKNVVVEDWQAETNS